MVSKISVAPHSRKNLFPRQPLRMIQISILKLYTTQNKTLSSNRRGSNVPRAWLCELILLYTCPLSSPTPPPLPPAVGLITALCLIKEQFPFIFRAVALHGKNQKKKQQPQSVGCYVQLTGGVWTTRGCHKGANAAQFTPTTELPI